MNDIYMTEKLNSIRNEMSHLWGGIFITGGGAITIILTTGWTTLQITFCILGVLMSVLFINAYLIRKQELMNNLSELNKE